MSRTLCSKRAALLPWTQNTHVWGDRSRMRYAYSMASCDLLTPLATARVYTGTNLPSTTKSDKCSPRSGPGVLLVDLIEKGSLIDGGHSVDEVCVAAERNDDRRTRRGFYTFCMSHVKLAGHASRSRA